MATGFKPKLHQQQRWTGHLAISGELQHLLARQVNTQEEVRPQTQSMTVHERNNMDTNPRKWKEKDGAENVREKTLKSLESDEKLSASVAFPAATAYQIIGDFLKTC